MTLSALRRSAATPASVFMLVAVSAWAAFLIVRGATSSAAPSIHVRWASSIDDASREVLEEQLTLVAPRALGGNGFAYDLLDSRGPSIRRLVEHPAVADTQDLDREGFTLTPQTPAGQSVRWLWHRRGTHAGERYAERTLQTFAALSVVTWIWSARWRLSP